MRVSLICLAFLALASAKPKYFRASRCNTNFDNDDNWKGPSLQVSDEELIAGEKKAVREARMKPPTEEQAEKWQSIHTHARAGNYKAKALVFSDNMKMTFDTSGFKMDFIEEQFTEGITELVAGQEYKPECDIGCHNNYLDADVSRRDTEEDLVSEDVPCGHDEFIIETGYSVKLYATTFFRIFSMKFGPQPPVFDAMDIPQYSIFPSPHHLKIDFEGGADLCAQYDLYDSLNQCPCFSTCADAEDHLDNAKNIRDIAEVSSLNDLAALNANIRKVFTGQFNIRTLASYMTPSSQVDNMFSCLFDSFVFTSNDQSLPSMLIEALHEEFGIDTLFTSMEFDYPRRRVILTGTVDAKAHFFRKLLSNGEYVDDWDDDFNINNRDDFTAPFQRQLWEALLDQATDCRREEIEETKEQNLDMCDGKFSGLCTILSKLPSFFSDNNLADVFEMIFERLRDFEVNSATAAPTDEPTTEEEDATTEPPFRKRRDSPTVDPTEEGTEDMPSTTEAFDFTIEYNGVMIDMSLMPLEDTSEEAYLELKENLLNLLLSLPLYETTFDEAMQMMETFVNDVLSQMQFEENDDKRPIPQPQTFTFPGTFTGRRLPQSDLNHIAGPNNAAFAEFLAEQLGSVWPLSNIDPASVKWELKDPNEQERRRSSVLSAGYAQVLLWVTFDYDMMILESECQSDPQSWNCPAMMDSPLYDFITETLDDIVSVYDIEAEKCFNMNQGIDEECVRDEVKSLMGQCMDENPDYTRDWLINSCGVPHYLEQFGCGAFSANREGDCHDPSADALRSTRAAATVPVLADELIAERTVTTTLNPNTNTGGSSASIAPIAGGAAAAVIIIIVIVVLVVVLRGRDSDDTSKSASNERTVVAFENPIYSDGNNASDLEPVYDATLPIDEDDEGLYDEPAFNASVTPKENPMYKSSEELTILDDPTYGDVIDITADNGGYLQQDEDEFEDEDDGGYLDVGMEPDVEDDDEIDE